MKGVCYIDGTDIYQKFGVVISRGGYGELLTFPPLKTPPANDWPEEDGIEPDLTSPMLEAKEVTIPFLVCDTERIANDFIAFVNTPVYRTLSIPELGSTWRLRPMAHPSNSITAGATSFSLRFSIDMPDRPQIQATSNGGGVTLPEEVYELDAIPFSRYGIVVKAGIENLLISPSIKQDLTHNFTTSDGQQYEATAVRFHSKDLTLNCCFVVKDISTFWKCYEAFFSALIQPGERMLYVEFTGEEYPCYYKNTSGFTFTPMPGKLLVEFNLTLVFPVFRIDETDYILATERDEWIVLEQDGETAIDLKPADH